MSFVSHFPMPSAFHMEAPNGAAPLSGVHAGVLRSPGSPSIANSMYMGRSTGSIYSDVPAPALNVKRKRHEPRGAVVADSRTEVNMGSGRPHINRRISSGRGIRYIIAGSVESPSGLEQKQVGDLDDSTYSDVDYRRALCSTRTNEISNAPYTIQPISSQPPVGWSRFALDAIGGVVGRVWDFCKEGTFRGFYAGGGRGYDVPPSPVQRQVWCNEHDIPTLPEIPGGFPELDHTSYRQERSTPESTPPPAAKRRHIIDTGSNDELRKNWIMVTDPVNRKQQLNLRLQPQSVVPQPGASPGRRMNNPISNMNNTGAAQANSSAVSHAGSATLSNRQPASFASPRSIAPERPRTPSRLPIPSRPRSSSTLSPRIPLSSSQVLSPTPYAPSRGHRRSQSTASAMSSTPARFRRRESCAKDIVEESSPRLDPKARNMVVKKMKQEQEADARINNFNTRLMDMIRQGKEALGTTVEVNDYDDFDVGGPSPWEDAELEN